MTTSNNETITEDQSTEQVIESTSYVSSQVDDLVKDREHWEQNEFLASNKVLYGLLAKCMGLAAKITESRKLQIQLDEVLAAYQVRLTSGTPLITKVIKVVFGAERRRASAYSLAVREAKKADVKPEELPEWLTAKGGIEEVRTAEKLVDGMNPAELREHHKTKGEKIIDAAASLSSIAKSEGTPESVGPTLMLARVEADRTTTVLCFVNNETLVKAALEFMGKQAGKNGESGDTDGTDAVDEAVKSVSESEQSVDEKAA